MTDSGRVRNSIKVMTFALAIHAVLNAGCVLVPQKSALVPKIGHPSALFSMSQYVVNFIYCVIYMPFFHALRASCRAP